VLRKCIRNVVVLDPDMVYAFTSPIIEIDHLCRCDQSSDDELCSILGAQGYVVFENVSDKRELPVKTAKRALLTLAKVPSIVWRFPKGRGGGPEGEEREREVYVRPVDVMLFGELINAAFYWQLFMPDEVGGFSAVENIYKILGELFGSDAKDRDVDAYELLNLLKERSDNVYKQAAEFVRERLKDLRDICKADVWVILIQKGVEEHRFRSICRSIQMLKELCASALKSGGKPGNRVYYILSPEALGFLERKAGEKKAGTREDGGSEPRNGDMVNTLISKCEPRPKRVDRIKSSCEGLPRDEGSHLLVLTRVRGIDVIEALRCINKDSVAPVVFVFGDYDKDALKTIVQNGLASRIAVVNEAFYGVTTGAKYIMGSYYGYLQGIDVGEWRRGDIARKIKEDGLLEGMMKSLSSEVCQESEEGARDVCLSRVLTLLLKVVTVVPVSAQV